MNENIIQAQLTANSSLKYIFVNQSEIVMYFCKAVFFLGYQYINNGTVLNPSRK